MTAEEQPKNTYHNLKMAAIILIVVCLGLFAINQAFSFRYKAVFLQQPCTVCQDLNQNQSSCIDRCFQKSTQLNPYADGQWKDSYGNCYNNKNEPTPCNGINLSNLKLN